MGCEKRKDENKTAVLDLRMLGFEFGGGETAGTASGTYKTTGDKKWQKKKLMG